MAPSKKAVDIETLLQWAYGDELAKRKTAVTWDTITDYGARGGVAIDDGHHGQSSPVQRYAYVGEPHADAVAVESMVAALEDIRCDAIDWEESKAELFGPSLLAWANEYVDWQKSRRDACGVFVDVVRLANPFDGGAAFGLPTIVRRCATLKRCPDWERDVPHGEKLRPPSGGHPIAVFVDAEGRYCTTKAQRGGLYPKGTFWPTIWYPTPGMVAWARAEYALWWGAMVSLAESLNDGWLCEHVALPPAAPEQPWITGEPAVARVLQDMAAKRPNLLGRVRRRALGRAPIHRDPGRRLDIPSRP